MIGTLRSLGWRLALFAALWTILTDADWSHPEIAALSIAAASVVSLRLWRPPRQALRWSAVPALLGYFLWHSLQGGLDVARRVFAPAMPIQPAILEYDCTVGGAGARVLFAWMIGLMPGTASVGWGEHGRLVVHVIDERMYDAAGLAGLEQRLLRVLAPPTSSPRSP